MSALERILSKNSYIEQELEILRKEFSSIKNDSINKKIEQIQAENDELKKQVQIARQQLIQLEIANGKKQIPVPGQDQILSEKLSVPTPSAAVKATPVAEPIADVKQDDKKEKQAKKEKPKKEKAPPAEKPGAAPEVPIDVGRLDMRVGKIVEVDRHPDADSLYLEKIDIGEPVPRTVVSGLVKHIPIDQMRDRLVVVLCNLKPAKMRGILSEAMVMCASSPEKVELMSPPPGSVPGDLVHCEGYTRNPDAQMNPKKKIFETVAPDLLTNDDLIGCYKGAPLYVPDKGKIVSQTLKNVNIK